MLFSIVGISLEWSGSGVNEIGKNAQNGKLLVSVDPAYFRPTEVDLLIGDATKAKQKVELCSLTFVLFLLLTFLFFLFVHLGP